MSANRWDPSPPTGRHDFEIAIMCALSLEAEAVTALFDKRWDSKTYGKATGDTNTYSIGAIGCHNVVLVHLPNMGKVAAATAAAFLRISYERIKLALVVGICGGVPFGKSSNDEILLGDVVVSDGIIQYDFGRQYPHKFIRKDHVRDNLPRPSPPMRTFLAKLQAKQTRSRLQEQTLEYLKILQELDNTATYPGVTEDRLFKPTYRHKHHELLECQVCGSGTADVCDTALKLSCEHLGCNEQELVFRARSTRLPGMPVIHFGLIASGDSVMKSGEDRDSAAFRDEFIAFEMEGAGVWETFPSCLIIKGVCDYADSHKSKRWQAYAAATAAATTKAVLENWNTETVDHLSSLSPHHPILTATDTVPLNPARKVAIFKTLYTSPYRDRKERNPDRVPRTCEWFVAHNSFQQWRESTSSSMLWVSADPGCGKSVLAKYLVDSQLPTTESRTTCYFFFKDDFADQRSAKSALCCILHQLFKQREILLSNKIAERFETDGEHLTGSFGELWDVLVTASQDKNAGEIVCILDAFDECEDHGRSELTRCLHKFYSTKNNFNLKFLLTSRPYGDIRRGFQSLEIPGLPVIHLSGESEIEMKKIAREIDIYIKAKVRSIREILRLKPVEEQLLLQKLLSIPNRTYLWAHLTLDLVQNDINIDKTGISKATSQLPQTVDEAYERILTKSRNFEEAKKLLHIVVVAARPLTLSEMNLALALRESHRSYKDLDLRLEERFREYVRDLCGLFVTIIASKIYLLHQTAREFLVQDGFAGSRKSDNNQLKWKYSLQTRESHRILSQICIWHLLFVEFETYPLNDNWILSEYLRDHDFLDYSAKNWAAHFRMSRTENNAVTASLLKICDVNLKRCSNWFRIYWESTHGGLPENFTTLLIASYFGLEQLVKLLLKAKTVNLSSRDGTYGRSALSWASENGFDDIVKLLIKGGRIRFNDITKLSFSKGAKVEAKDIYGRTPLSYAARKGHVAVVKRLVKMGARIDSKDDIGGTPISYALCNGQDTLISLLLQNGHQVDSVRNILQPLLLSAAEKGDATTVKLLLESGKVDADSTDEYGQTPLSWASEKGHEVIVKLLLESGKVDADSKDEYGRTPLSLASQYGYEAIIKLLLESGKVDADSTDEYGRTPLSWASQYGHEAIIKLLLESGKVDADSTDKYGQTPLSWASEKGYEVIVKLLLESGKVDADSKDEYGRTPLSLASQYGYEATIKLLLKSGKVVTDSKDEYGRTPLSWASQYGYEAIIKLLLKSSEVDTNSKDEYGRTPLSWATRNGHVAVVKLLLEIDKIDADLKDNNGRAPLLCATRNGHTDVVQLLLESGRVDTDLKDIYDQTPLSWATQSGHAAIIKLLKST